MKLSLTGKNAIVTGGSKGIGKAITVALAEAGARTYFTYHGSEEKADLAREHGCHHTIIYTQEDFVERVNEITDGKGVNVVYDAVGKDTFLKGFDCLQPFGFDWKGRR